MSTIHLFSIQVCIVWCKPSVCKYTFDWQANEFLLPPSRQNILLEWKKKKQISKFLVYELKRDSIQLNRLPNGNLYFQGEARREK